MITTIVHGKQQLYTERYTKGNSEQKTFHVPLPPFACSYQNPKLCVLTV